MADKRNPDLPEDERVSGSPEDDVRGIAADDEDDEFDDAEDLDDEEDEEGTTF